MSNKVLIFAHFHSRGLLRDDTVRLLSEAVVYFKSIFFVSTNILDEELKKLHPSIIYCKRDNYGYDFYSYREGLLRAGVGDVRKNDIDLCCLMNSSVLCIDARKFWSKVFARSFRDDVLYGLTRSFQITEHIQSYLLIFGRKIFRNEAFLNWWVDMQPISIKEQVVLQCELGFSSKVKELGYRCEPIFEHSVKMPAAVLGLSSKYRKIFAGVINRSMSPTTFHWRNLYEEYSIIKVDLLKNNDDDMDLRPLLEMASNSADLVQGLNQAFEN